MRPQGRKTVDLSRLQRVMPSYWEMVTKGLTLKDILERLPEEPEPPDQETIRRDIQDLAQLLSPKL